MRCAIYARYSSELQDKKSIEDQVRECKDFALKRGWEVLEGHIYFDKAVSGASTKDREGLKAMIRDALINPRPFDRILVDDTSRVARNTVDALRTFQKLKFRGIHLSYISQGIDTALETAEEIITLHGMVDSLYIRELSKKTHRGLKGRALAGLNAAGCPFGYKIDYIFDNSKKNKHGNPIAVGGRRVIEPSEAEIVKRIFEMYIGGMTPRKITEVLNAEGLPSPRGGSWSFSAIYGHRKKGTGILNNEQYIGRYIWNRTEWIKDPETGVSKRFERPEEEWVIIENPELRIVSDELWNKVKKRQGEMAKKSSPSYKGGKNAKYVLSGLLKCHKCGSNYILINRRYYGCSTHKNRGSSVCDNRFTVLREDIENFVIPLVTGEIYNEDYFECIRKKAEEALNLNTADHEVHKTLLQKELKEHERKQGNIVKAIEEGIVTKATKDRLLEVEEKIKEINEKLIKTPVKSAKKYTLKSTVKEEVNKLEVSCKNYPYKARVLMIRLIDRIILKPETKSLEVEIYPRNEITASLFNKTFFLMVGGAGFEPATSTV